MNESNNNLHEKHGKIQEIGKTVEFLVDIIATRVHEIYYEQLDQDISIHKKKGLSNFENRIQKKWKRRLLSELYDALYEYDNYGANDIDKKIRGIQEKYSVFFHAGFIVHGLDKKLLVVDIVLPLREYIAESYVQKLLQETRDMEPAEGLLYRIDLYYKHKIISKKHYDILQTKIAYYMSYFAF